MNRSFPFTTKELLLKTEELFADKNTTLPVVVREGTRTERERERRLCRSSESRDECVLFNFVSFVQCPPKGRHARLKILREGVVALWCKTKAALEKNKRTAHKSRVSEKGTAER